jgi:cyclomaltodextrinase / maltogenic alpha-amylase / neopullulanase
MNLTFLALGGLMLTNSALASAPMDDPRAPAWRIEPICGDLGLMDVLIAGAPDAAGFEVALEGVDGRGRAIPCHPGLDDGRPAWRTRVMTEPSPDGVVRFWIRDLARGDGGWDGPFDGRPAPGPELAPPAWALGAVWYQVFPERFANGNKGNDPSGPEIFRKDWNSAWEKVGVEEVEAARARASSWPLRYRLDPEQAGGALYSVVLARRYGGDLEGLAGRLDQLADLGVTALYLNPVFASPSLHKYDASDYRHVDPTLAGAGGEPATDGETLEPATWGWTSADRYLIDTLLPEARRRGIRVVVDGVWNHTSTRFWAFEDMRKNGSGSPFSGWYNASFADGRLDAWKGWDRANGNLPEFARGEDGNLVRPVRDHIADITRRWMDPDGDGNPADGIDGWRLDVANDMPMSFWQEWCALVRRINPAAVMIGELWFIAKDHLRGGVFDSQMNYPFARAAIAWLDGRPGFGSRELGEALMAASDHPARVNLAQMNLLGSHDTARLATMLANPGRGYGGQEKIAHGADAYFTGRPGPEIYDLVVLGVALQVLWPGSPMVYGGDEWGVFGADDPDDRKPVPWPDCGPYENPEEAPDPALRDRFRGWLRLRSDPIAAPVLRFGDVRLLDAGEPDVFAFIRSVNGRQVVAVLNRGLAGYSMASLAARVGGLPPDAEVHSRSAAWWLLPDPR